MKRFKFAEKVIHYPYWPMTRPVPLSSQPASPETKGTSTADSIPGFGLNLNVMSFNIRRGTRKDGRNHWIYRRRLVQEILNAHRPDVLGLQEALDFQMAEVSAMLPGYEKVGLGNLGGSKGLHNAIFYDAGRFQLSEEETFWLSDAPETPGSRGWGNLIPRICTWVRLIEKTTRQAFYFYNTHLDHLSLRARKKSVIFLTQHIHRRPYPDPIVLTGDFNAGEGSMPIRYLKGDVPLKLRLQDAVYNPLPLLDTFRVQHPQKRNAVTYHGYHRHLFRWKLDYIFVSSSARVIGAEIIQHRWENCFPSDHFPLFARIDLSVAIGSSDIPPLFAEAMNS